MENLVIRNKLEFRDSDEMHIGIDIGGSLTKIAIIIKKENLIKAVIDMIKLSYHDYEEIYLDNNYLLIIHFLTNNFYSEILTFLKSNILNLNI